MAAEAAAWALQQSSCKQASKQTNIKRTHCWSHALLVKGTACQMNCITNRWACSQRQSSTQMPLLWCVDDMRLRTLPTTASMQGQGSLQSLQLQGDRLHSVIMP